MNMQQDSGEPIRSFYAKVKGRASTCSYVVSCKCNPPTKVDYTQLIVKDVLMNGLVDEDIKKEILGMDDLDDLEIESMISRIESKETARNALNRSLTTSAGISAFKKQTALAAAEEKKLKMEVKCGDCSTKIKAYIRGRQGKLVERKWCKECFIKSHRTKNATEKISDKMTDEAASLMKVGSIQISPVHCISPVFTVKNKRKAVILDHHIFLPGSNAWKRSESQPQPMLRLRVFSEPTDYLKFELPPPDTKESFIDCVADTGAQSCLMGTRIF